MTALNTLTITVEADGGAGVVNIFNDLPYQTITYAGAVNSFRPDTIADQIVAAVPVARIEPTASGDMVRVHVPKTQSQAAIAAVIAAHDPTVKSERELRVEDVTAQQIAMKDFLAQKGQELTDGYTNWASLTAGQKDALARVVLGVVVRLLRHFVRERRLDV